MIDIIAKNLPALQVVLPLMSAPFCAIFNRSRLSWIVAFVISIVSFAIAATLLSHTLDGEIISYHLGGWAPPIGIEYRIDVLNAFVLLIVSGIAVVTLPYAAKSVALEIPEEKRGFFYTAFLLCFTGLLGVTITGDAFNVFVFLEISSLSTYALVATGAERNRRALSAAYNYLIMGTVGATFFVIGLGLLYMATGTLNMVDLAHQIAERGDSRMLHMGFAFVLVGIGLKLAMFPLHLWLPNAYTFAPSAVSVFISATSTKVAVYVLLRFMFGIFGFDYAYQESTLQYLLLPLALLAMFAASIVAVFQTDLKRMLAYSSIAQIGYMLLGIAFMSQLGVMATVIHLFNHAVTKATLFMVAGAFIYTAGTSRISDLKGLGRAMPWTSAAFVVGGLSLIGIPLTVGFVSKWYLVQAALELGWWPVAAAIVLSSLIAIAYVWRIVEMLYLHSPSPDTKVKEAPLAMVIPMWILAGATIYFGTHAALTSAAASRAASTLISASNIIWQ